MAIEGPLRDLGIQDVFQLLELTRKTGVLSVRSERLGDEALVHFDHGAVVFAVRRRSIRRLGQQLLRAGKLTERELEHALEIQRQNPMSRLGEILLEMGSVNEEDLGQQLRLQVEETIFDLMAWDEGYFRFEEHPDLPEDAGSVRVSVESLLMEGARRIDEWTRLEHRIPNLEVVPVLVSVDAEGAPLQLRTEEWEVLAEIDGERDLRQLAADIGKSSFEVAKTVYGLVSMGIVEVAERTPQLPEAEVEQAVAGVESLLERGEHEAAAKVVAELETAYPERSELAMLAGRVLVAQGRMRAATEAYGRAAALDPLAPAPHYHLGFAAIRIGEIERAAQALNTYVQLSDDDGGGAEKALQALRTLQSVMVREDPND